MGEEIFTDDENYRLFVEKRAFYLTVNVAQSSMDSTKNSNKSNPLRRK